MAMRHGGPYWSAEEHAVFLEALTHYQLNQAQRIAAYINRRISPPKTVKQVQGHCRSYRRSLERVRLVCDEEVEESTSIEEDVWPVLDFCELLAVDADWVDTE